MLRWQAALVTLLVMGLQAPAEAIPQAGALAFGTAPSRVERALGKGGNIDDVGSFVWLTYKSEEGTVRIAYSRNRVSSFVVLPSQPLTWAEASAWANAFLPGFASSRLKRDNPAHWVAFKNFILLGRPFEAQLNFERDQELVTSMGGEIHWMD